MSEVLAKHPRPWRVTQEYKDWTKKSNHAENPPAIVDALYRSIPVSEDRQRQGFNHTYDQENDEHIVVTSSEWLNMSVEVGEVVVASVNAHDALVAALEAMKVAFGVDGRGYPRTGAAMDQCNAALALARKGG